MKPIITALAVASLFTMGACNRSTIQEKNAAIETQQRIIDSMNDELAKKKVIDSMNEMSRVYVFPENVAPAAAAPVRRTSARRATRRSYAGQTSQTNSSGSNTVAQAPAPVYTPAPVPEKRGWSAKAKGAVIGTATGAAAGAIINKRNREAGAVIGGVLGAAAGTGVGAVIDKKKGR